jgi:hypothetical protein
MAPRAWPWRLAHGTDPYNPDFLATRETPGQYRERAGQAELSSPPTTPDTGVSGEPAQVRRYELSCGYFEHSVQYGNSVAVTVRLQAAPTRDDAVQLVLPAIYSQITETTGVSDWQPSFTSLEARELLD